MMKAQTPEVRSTESVASGSKKGRAVWCIALLVARKKSGAASKRIRVVLARKGSVIGIVGVASGVSISNFLDDLLVENDADALSKRGNKFLDRSLPLFSILRLEVLDHSLSKTVQISSGGVNGKQTSDREKVEHIVNGSSSEKTFKLVTIISHVSHDDNGAGNRGTNVGSHNQKDSLLDRNGVSSDKGEAQAQADSAL